LQKSSAYLCISRTVGGPNGPTAADELTTKDR
jgi:hypothetical protein